MKNPIYYLLFTVILVGCSSKKNDSEVIFTVEENDLFQIDSTQEFTFGYLKVPENRSTTSDKTISLPVYIFKSRKSNPKPDPIIYTVGGPGNSTMPSAQYMKYYKYLDDRDFILIEQRGTEFAKPSLDCPEWSKAIHRSNFIADLSKKDSILSQAALACRNKLIAKEIDLNGYNTLEIATDIEDLRKALEIEKYNLLTLSYSTKIAQVLMRDYPDHIRSVVMDSPLPLEVNFEEETVINLMESFEKVFSACKNNAECERKFPDLKIRFRKYLMEKTEAPLEITVINPHNQKEEKFNLMGKDILSILKDNSKVPDIPYEIDKILNGDYELLKSGLAYLFDDPPSGKGIGMRLSVWCSEELPFTSSETIKDQLSMYPEIKGISPYVFNKKICDTWKIIQANQLENSPIKSKIPTLLLTGEFDPITPSKWARILQKDLENAHHIEFGGWKHGVTTNWGNPCGMEIANAFFNNPSKKPNLNCIDSLEIKFRLN